jgi:GNAT superfamily N-acetyltransferase
MNVSIFQTRDIHSFIPVLQEIELGDRFLLSMLHWCGIGKRSAELPFWEVYLAMLDNTPVGVCGLYRNDGMPANLAWLSWLGVRKSYRHRGVGAAMLASLLKAAYSKHEISELWVYTDSSQPEVHRYYERAGFRYVGAGGIVAPDVVMSPSEKVFFIRLTDSGD